jgi:hypothetical protein
MKSNNPALLEKFLNSMPLAFLEGIRDSIRNSYKEAHHRGFDDPAWGQAESGYLTPHFRRAIVEKVVRDVANKNGLLAHTQENSKKTSEYTLVKADDFLFTISHSANGGSVNPAKFRSKNAELNSLLSQASFEGEQFDSNEIFSNTIDGIYAILIHGAEFDKTTPSFIDFAFPDSEKSEWLDRYCIDDLITAKRGSINTAEIEDDKAFPIPRRKRNEQGE